MGFVVMGAIGYLVKLSAFLFVVLLHFLFWFGFFLGGGGGGVIKKGGLGVAGICREEEEGTRMG